MRLMKEGLIDRYDPASWHSHAFRASFKTTAEHVGIDSSIVEFWMGHDQGIEAVYNYRDQVHESDFEEAYRRLEPHISLDYTEIAVREEYESTNKQMMQLILELQKKVARFEAQQGASGTQGHAASPEAQT